MWAGWWRTLASVGIALGGGFGFWTVLNPPLELDTNLGVLPGLPSSRRVAEVVGDVRLERGGLAPRVLFPGIALPAPAVVTTHGPRSQARIEFRKVNLRLSDEARVLFAAEGSRLRLEQGQLIVTEGQLFAVSVAVPPVEFAGRSFAVRGDREGFTAVAFDGPLEVRTGETPGDVPPLQIVASRGGQTMRAALGALHTVEIIEVLRRGRGTRIQGQTSPFSKVSLRIRNALAEGEADAEGLFLLEVPVRTGEPAIMAQDVVGRVATLVGPGPHLNEYLAALGTKASLPPSDVAPADSTPAETSPASEAEDRFRAGEDLSEVDVLPEGEDPAPRPRRRSRPVDKTSVPPPAPAKGGVGRRGGVPETVDVEFGPTGARFGVELDKLEVIPGEDGPGGDR